MQEEAQQQAVAQHAAIWHQAAQAVDDLCTKARRAASAEEAIAAQVLPPRLDSPPICCLIQRECLHPPDVRRRL